ncbi:hypothetical protein IPA_04785 [Ignicoccus pacificus DSM 13166]|uniref:Uncharacterized protein n=1 Tax=Ignicoccus pacificus DSM 13166 TaxID=940294 RepID=A0A977PLF3_9CREN|nr:hypothetical protein IPA_04785 [Ignicoccus pacificus DSM 13166]
MSEESGLDLNRDERRPVWGTTMTRKPDFLRQIFNVILAKHQDELEPRNVSELRKMVWVAENKFKFSSFENPDPTENLKKFFESKEFGEVLRLLKQHERVVEDLIEEIKKYYGEELASIIKRRLEEIKSMEE